MALFGKPKQKEYTIEDLNKMKADLDNALQVKQQELDAKVLKVVEPVHKEVKQDIPSIEVKEEEQQQQVVTEEGMLNNIYSLCLLINERILISNENQLHLSNQLNKLIERLEEDGRKPREKDK